MVEYLLSELQIQGLCSAKIWCLQTHSFVQLHSTNKYAVPFSSYLTHITSCTLFYIYIYIYI
jgi:hypothetical protein